MRLAKSVEKIEDALTIALLVLALLLPALDSLLDVDPTEPPLLNRSMAPAPRIALRDLGQLPATFEAFFDDHFGFKDFLIRSKSVISIFVLGTSPSTNILLGRDRWLFLSGAIFGQEGRAIDDFSGRHPFTQQELESWRTTLERRHDLLAKRGVEYVFVIAPNKATIYPEQLPRGVAERRGRSRQDQLMAWLERRSKFRVFDLRPALTAAKAEGRLYEKTGTHWNEQGGFAADAALARTLAGWFPAIRPLSAASYEAIAFDGPPRDLAMMVGVADLMREEHWKMKPRGEVRARRMPATFGLSKKRYAPPFATERKPKSLPRAVIFHDSFYKDLQPFLSEHFSRAVYYWQYDIDLAAVKDERADIVIQLVNERVLLHDLVK